MRSARGHHAGGRRAAHSHGRPRNGAWERAWRQRNNVEPDGQDRGNDDTDYDEEDDRD